LKGAVTPVFLAHIAVVVGEAGGDGTTWLEPVSEEEYLPAHRAVA
jgi:hypothetical protein